MGCGSSVPVGEHEHTVKGTRDFSAIDKHARKTPKSVAVSIIGLAEYLVQPAKDDIDKVRALYVWVCENIRYDVDSFFSGQIPSQEPEGVLKRKMSVCEGYATLFRALCNAIDIECKKISGFSKGYGHNPGDVISYKHQTDHAWNVVYVEEKWQFIETTWGSGYLNEGNRYVKDFTDFYFLTSPEDFIVDHFPYMDYDKDESSKWQLLSNPVSLEQFSKALNLTKAARKMKVEFPNTPFEVLECNGNCQFKVICKSMLLRDMNIILFDESGHQCMNSAVMIREGLSAWRAKIHPSCKGKFHLRVFGGVLHSKKMDCLAEMCIKCSADVRNFEPLPVSDMSFGPRSDQGDFIDENFPSPLLECRNQEADILLPTKIQCKAMAVVIDSDQKQINNSAWCQSVGKSIRVTVRLLKLGYFRVMVMSNSGSGNHYDESFNLLVHS